MPTEPFRLSIENTRKWHALAERRRAYFVELYRSGRWRRYYAEDAFLAHLREVMQSVEQWAEVLKRWDTAAPGENTRTAA
jgi:uncharacterized repeat protein (TIGR03809 family)